MPPLSYRLEFDHTRRDDSLNSDPSTLDLLTVAFEGPIRESGAPATRSNQRSLLWTVDCLLEDLRSHAPLERCVGWHSARQ